MAHATPVDQSPWVPAVTAGAELAARDGALAAFLQRVRRLPTFSRSYAYHQADDSVSGAEVARALRALQGKFAVVNPALVVPLPPAAVRRVARLAAAAARRVGARGAGAGVALALHEPAPATVLHDATAAGTGPESAHDCRFFGALRYRLTVAMADAASAEPGAAVERRVSRPIPWFDIALLVPDADALRQMAPPTAHYYRHITGRLGPDSRDSYWCAASWERFREPGRIIGCVHPQTVGFTRTALQPPATASDDALAAFLFAPTGERSRWGELTPTFDRRLSIPPGYCLIRYGCWLELALVERRALGASAAA